MEARHYVISGKVQGVYYRKSTKLTADGLKLKGWVKNLEDGRVEAYAAGSSSQLQAFEKFLHEGPPNARVVEVVIEDTEVIAAYVSFEIVG